MKSFPEPHLLERHSGSSCGSLNIRFGMDVRIIFTVDPAVGSCRQTGKPFPCQDNGDAVPLLFAPQVVDQLEGRHTGHPFGEKAKGGGRDLLRKVDLDQPLGLPLPGERKIDLAAVLGPDIMQGDIVPGRVLQIMDMLLQTYGTGILQPDSLIALDVAAVVKIDLRLPQDRPRHVGMEGADGKNDAEAFQDVDPPAQGLPMSRAYPG